MDPGAESYRRFLAGDDKALTEILKQYREGLTLFLDGYVHNIADAEDLAQDVFVKLCVKKPPFKGESAFKTWLFSIGRRAAIDHLRKNRRVSDGPPDETLAAETQNVEETYLRAERDETVWRAMQRLPEAYREILFLTYFEGLPNKAAAKVLHKSTHNVETLVSRARKALRSALEKEEFDNESL